MAVRSWLRRGKGIRSKRKQFWDVRTCGRKREGSCSPLTSWNAYNLTDVIEVVVEDTTLLCIRPRPVCHYPCMITDVPRSMWTPLIRHSCFLSSDLIISSSISGSVTVRKGAFISDLWGCRSQITFSFSRKRNIIRQWSMRITVCWQKGKDNFGHGCNIWRNIKGNGITGRWGQLSYLILWYGCDELGYSMG